MLEIYNTYYIIINNLTGPHFEIVKLNFGPKYAMKPLRLSFNRNMISLIINKTF